MKLHNSLWRARVALFCLLLAPGWSSAQLSVLNIPVDKDSYTDSYNASTNYGSATTLGVSTFTDPNQVVQYRRAFVQFDLSGIPEGREIYSIRIVMRRSAAETGNPSYVAQRVNASWAEGTITHANQPALSSLTEDQSETYTSQGDTIFYNVSYMAKRMFWGMKANYGFCIHLKNETVTNKGTSFYSQESGTFEPYLEVKYYDPLTVSTTTITHASATTTTDASIVPSLSGGASSSYTYQWINGSTGSVISTSASLTGVAYGWYGLHVTGSYGEDLYQGFLVGVENQNVTINYTPDGNYTQNCYVYNAIVNGVDYKTVNFKNSNVLLARHQFAGGAWRQTESFVDFNLWMDPRFEVLQADMTLQGNSHIISSFRSNASELLRVTSDWDEEVVTYNNQPDYNTSIYAAVSAVTSTKQDKTLDISSFWDIWKLNNQNNFGVKFQLQDTVTDLNVAQNYHSPNATLTADRPLIQFQLHLEPVYVSTTWDEVSETGTVEVDISSISGTVAPYHYLISEYELPTMEEMYYYLKDSVLFGDLDSVSFFTGKESSTAIVFEDLTTSPYYIYVYDNAGDLVLSESVLVRSDITFSEMNGILVTGDRVEGANANAYGLFEWYTNENTDSRVTYNFEGISGQQIFGWIDASVNTVGTDEIEMGFVCVNNVLRSIVDGVVSTNSTIVTDSSIVIIDLTDTLFRMSVDGNEIVYLASPTTFDYQLGLRLPSGGSALVAPSNVVGPANLYTLTANLGHMTCDNPNGALSWSVKKLGSNASISVNYTITNTTTSQVSTGTTTTMYLNTFQGWGGQAALIPPGIYTITGTINSNPAINFSQTLYLGYKPDWEQLDYYTSPLNQSNSVFRDGTNSGLFSTARSSNILKPNENGWIEFNPNVMAGGLNFFRPLVINISQTLGAATLSTEEYLVFYKMSPNSPVTCYVSSLQNGSSSFQMGSNGRIRVMFSTGSQAQTKVYLGNTLKFTFSRTAAMDFARFNSVVADNGFKKVVTSFGCLPSDKIYGKLKYNLDGYYHTMKDGYIHFTFDQEYDAENLTFDIYDMNDQLIASQADFSPMATTHGMNYLTLDVRNSNCIGRGFFYLEVTNSKKEKSYLRFFNDYSSPGNCNDYE